MRQFLQNHKLMLAPMAGVNDVVFRKLCIENGAMLTYTEMISSKGLSYKNGKTESLLNLADNETQVVVQIFGHEPEVMAEQAAEICDKLDEKLAYLDINMGCPVKKLVKKGEGSALMKDVDNASNIVSACVNASRVPVTAKFRRGYNNGDETCVEFAKAIEQAGAAAVTVHGRYAQQFYRGKCDWSAIKRVIDAISIPVIGSGDVANSENYKQALETGVSAVMIGRAAQGNPWVFNQILNEEPLPNFTERVQMARRHVHEYADYYGDHLSPMRKHTTWYMHGIPGAAIARGALNKCVTVDDFDRVFDKMLQSFDERGLY